MGSHSFRATFLLSILVVLFYPGLAFSGEYKVSPIRLFFTKGVKSSVLTVSNESTDPIQLQVRSFEWTQDGTGKDHYVDTQDVIFFPKLLELNKGERRVIRVGLKMPVADTEKTYRLFIEEIRKPQKEKKGAGVDISIRFGVPLFVAPVKEEINGTIDQISVSDGKISFQVHNPGNSHIMIESLAVKGSAADGTESFSSDLSGWYLLAGSRRTYETPFPREVCQDTAKITVEVKSEQITFSKMVDAINTLCLP